MSTAFARRLMRTGQECHCLKELSSLIFSDGFNDIIYQKYSRGTKTQRNDCNSVWYTFLLKAESIFFISGFLWICEVPSSANRCDKIPVWSTAHTKSSRHFSFLKIIPVKKTYGYGRKSFRSKKGATVHAQVIFSLKPKKNMGCYCYKKTLVAFFTGLLRPNDWN